MTRSSVTMIVSEETWQEIATILQSVGYDHAVIFLPTNKIHLDMNGIHLEKGPPRDEAIRLGVG